MGVSTSGPQRSNLTHVDGEALGTHASGYPPGDVRRWNGVAPNNLISGRVEAYVGAVDPSTKTGYSLTGGSYSIRVQGTQSGVIQITDGVNSDTTGIASVSTSRAEVRFGGSDANAADRFGRARLTSDSVVTAARFATAGTTNVNYEVSEKF